MRAGLGFQLGGDLGAVRVHDDLHADRLARDLGAKAFTAGADIYFRKGAYAPDSRRGLELLAHEAVHTVQQAQGPVSGTAGPDGVRMSDPADRHERQATRIAATIARSGQGPTEVGALDGRVPHSHDVSGEVTIQPWLNEEFGRKPLGVPTEEQTKRARKFASKVSVFAERARQELLTGDFDDWGKAGGYNAKGLRYAAFIDLLTRSHPTAVTHAGNVIEDRVYQLMAETNMGLTWKSQVEINTSRPDVVAELDDKYAVIDITSAVAHVVGKVGLWTADEVVYIAEAVFDSVTSNLLRGARKAILGEAAMTPEQLAVIEQEAEEKAAAKAQARRDLADELRYLIDDVYGSVAAYAEAEWDNDIKAASAHLRKYGVVRRGMSRSRRRSGVFDYEVAAERRREAYRLRKKSQKATTKKSKKRRRSEKVVRNYSDSD